MRDGDRKSAGVSNRAPLQIVYFALIASTFVYALIVWMLMGQRTPPGTIEEALRRPVVAVPMLGALAMFVTSFAVGGASRHRQIVRWALTESVTVFGLLASLLSGDWRLFVIGWMLSLVGFAMARPADERA
jgi:hypothetical protein